MKSAINRISWLDSVRGFAFLMVIYGHIVCCGNMVLNNYFAPVFLTSFFFVSGYLFKEDVSFWKFFEQRTRTLYIPSVILGLFILLTSVAFPVADPNNKINVGSEIIGIIFQFDGKHHGLWFLAALYSYSLLFWMLLKILKNNAHFGSVIFTLLYVANWAYLYLWGGYFCHGVSANLEYVHFTCI